MNLKELYQTIVSREDVPYASLKPRMRIAIVTPAGTLDVMKVDRVGEGRPSLDEQIRYMAVAKVCPGQASMTLSSDGVVCLNELMDVKSPDDPYMTAVDPWSELGVLRHRHRVAYWVDLDENTAIKRVQKSEMREIQGANP
jgi:hypothetical protein